MDRILIIDDSGFKETLENVIDKYNQQNPENKVEYVTIPNKDFETADKIKEFIIKNAKSFDVIFCHLRWIEENIEPLEQLRNSNWFQPILDVENRVGVSNGSDFRNQAENLGLFQYLYSHEGAKNILIEFLYE